MLQRPRIPRPHESRPDGEAVGGYADAVDDLLTKALEELEKQPRKPIVREESRPKRRKRYVR
jgi:hypothetical protein